MKTRNLLLIAPFLLAGCAGLKMEPINSEAQQQSARGFRYFETSPFLLIYSDSKGGLVSEVLYLPDSTKLRSIEPFAYAASNKALLKFDKGRLTQARAVVDETAIPVSVISALEKVAGSQIKAMNAPTDPKDTLPAPYLFRIVKVGDQWTLAGGQAIDANGNPSAIRYLP